MEARDSKLATGILLRANLLITKGVKASEEQKRRIETLLSQSRPKVIVAVTEEKAAVRSVLFEPKGDPKEAGLVFLTGQMVKREDPQKKTRVIVREVSLMDLSADQRFLVCAQDRTVIVFAFQTGKEVNRLAGHTEVIVSSVLAPQGSLLGTRDRAQALKVWNLPERRELARGQLPPGEGGIAWAPGGKILAAAVDDKVVFFAVQKESLRPLLGAFDKLKADTAITALVFRPDGLFLTGDKNGKVVTWDIDGGKRLLTLQGLRGPVLALACSPDGAALAAGDSLGKILVWDAASGEVRNEFTSELGGVASLGFSPDGTALAAGGEGPSKNGRVVTYKLRPLAR